MGHSNQVREYQISNAGIELIEPYIGPEGVMTGTARITQIAREAAAKLRRTQETEQRRREVVRRRAALERQIEELRAALDSEELEETIRLSEADAREDKLRLDREIQAHMRGHS